MTTSKYALSRCLRALTITFGAALALSAPAVAADVTSTFDSDLDGWTLVGDAAATPTHDSGGHARIADGEGGNVLYWRAPAKFQGNRQRAWRGSLSFDVRVSAFTEDAERDVVISGSGQTLVRELAPPTPGQWTHYEIPLDTGWQDANHGGVDEYTVLRVLEAVTQVWIRADRSPAADVAEIDNVVLRDGPAADLSVRAGVTDPDVEVGELITFRPAVTNHGGSPAEEVSATLTLPKEAEIVSGGEGCTYVTQIVCTAASLAPGETRTFELVARAIDNGAGFESVVWASTRTLDTDLSNNGDRVPHVFGTPETSYQVGGGIEQKTASGLDQPFVVNFTVSNAGPHPGPGSLLQVALSDALEVLGAPAGCRADGGPLRFLCDVGSVGRPPSFFPFRVRGVRVAPDAASRAEVLVRAATRAPATTRSSSPIR